MKFIFHGEIIDLDFKNINQPQTILFLHGWGGNKNSFLSLKNLFKNTYNCLSITLSTVDETSLIWDMHDYCEAIISILKSLDIKEVIVICHSFGFRIATLLKTKVMINKIIVTGGAGMKKTSIFKKIETQNNALLLKNKKNDYLFNSIASRDYLSLSPNNKQTFKNIVNFNTKNLVEFDCPMFLFWGKYDKETPLWIAHRLKKINHSQLVTTKSGHFAYLEHSGIFQHVAKKFLEE